MAVAENRFCYGLLRFLHFVMAVAENRFCYGNLQKISFVMAVAILAFCYVPKPHRCPKPDLPASATVGRSNGFDG